MGSPPIQTLEARRAALVKAAQARKARSEVKSSLRAGTMNINSILTSDNEAIKRMRVLHLLVALPGIGEVRAIAIMERCNISPTRRIQGLGIHQIRDLKKELGCD